jgi:N-acetyl-alpha-D-muramate 1-phosphate uridylyltransferase
MTIKPDTAMLFCAGFGTRMRALTRERPKPLIHVAGRPLVDHALALVRDAGIPRTVANLHYMADMLADHLAPLGVKLCREFPDILDTGGGLKAALPVLGPDPVFTLNTDAIWAGPNPLSLLQGAWAPARMDALLVCVPAQNAIGHPEGGAFAADAAGRIRRGGPLVYGGVQIVKTDALQHFQQPAFSLNRLWDGMQARDRLFGLTYPGHWCDVGHPEGIGLAENMLADHDV